MSEPDWGFLWRLTVGGPSMMRRDTCVCGEPIHHSGGWWSHDEDDSIQHDDGSCARPRDE